MTTSYTEAPESTASAAGMEVGKDSIPLYLMQSVLNNSKTWSYALGGHISRGLSEMVKWTVVQAINEIVRRPVIAVLDWIFTLFTVSVEVSSSDELYRHVSDWLSEQKFTKSSRELIAKASQAKKPEVIFYPGKGMHFFWYRRMPAWVWRAGSISQGSSALRITTFGRDTNRVKFLLQEALEFSKRTEIGKILVYTPNFRDINNPNTSNMWKPLGAARTPRAPSTLILLPGQYEDIIQDCKRFLNGKNWYAQRGIPYRRGFLFYGSPGSGKSSLTEVLAGALGLDISILTLAHESINDHFISLLFNAAPTDSIILLEDVDTMFESRKKEEEGAPKPKHNKLTFSGLLNALDGISAQGGRIIIMTTNHIEALDAALIRDGRVDKKIQFQNAIQYQALLLFARFFELNENDPRCTQFAAAIPEHKLSMAQLQGHLLMHQRPEYALAKLPELLKTIV